MEKEGDMFFGISPKQGKRPVSCNTDFGLVVRKDIVEIEINFQQVDLHKSV